MNPGLDSSQRFSNNRGLFPLHLLGLPFPALLNSLLLLVWVVGFPPYGICAADLDSVAARRCPYVDEVFFISFLLLEVLAFSQVLDQ